MTGASGKGPAAFRTISEASAELDVPQHVLRFWETRFAFVRPMKRAGGRRFYRPQDLDVLRGVRALLQDEGYTIKGVQKLHREQGLKRLVAAGGVGEAAAARLAAELEAETPEPSDDEAPPAEPAVALRSQPAAVPTRQDGDEDEEDAGPDTGDLFADLLAPAPDPAASGAVAEAEPASKLDHGMEDQASASDAATSPPEPPPVQAPGARSVLTAGAKGRLTEVLRDLEITKAGIDALLGPR